jgi:2-oxoglutarate ferredoxin oxidoreductase subunit delta
MSRIVVDEQYCKGCGLCVEACPHHIIVLDPNKITAKGYHPAMLTDESACTACENCALMCPDVAITVEKG